jgi:tetratricopeptide (TPR) repeat protein
VRQWRHLTVRLPIAACRQNVQIPYSLDCLGRAELALGRAKTAIPLLREALELRVSTCTPPECATTRYFLGRALWDVGGDRDEAIALVRDALAVFERDAALEPWIASYPAQARAWLDSHRPRGRYARVGAGGWVRCQASRA